MLDTVGALATADVLGPVLGTGAGWIVEWVVPEGVESVAIEACGAQGGDKKCWVGLDPAGGAHEGGRGARVVCRAAVRPGERLTVLVGQAGGTAKGATTHLGLSMGEGDG